MSEMDIKEKVAVVTGATGGIGRAIVEELDKLGVKLVLLGTHEEELKNLLSSLKTEGGRHYASNFSDPDEIIKISEKMSHEVGIVDILINLAGIGIYKSIEEVSLKDWQDSMSIGVTAPYFLTKALTKNMSQSDLSVVLNMGSGMGVIPAAGRSVYCTSKFALRGMTLSLAEEFKKTKPHFCLITLGSTLTPFGPMSLEEKKKEMEEGKAYFTPDWVAKKVVEIISNEDRDVEYRLYPSEYEGGSWKLSEEEK